MKIYLLDVSPLSDSSVFEKYYKLCPDYRKEKINRTRDEKARLLSLGAEILLSHGANNAGVSSYTVSISDSGKPFFENCNLEFNLSHSGKYVAAAFSAARVGIDIETPRKVNLKLSQRYFSPQENKALTSSPTPELDFLRIWTRKESLLKADGSGLSSLLNEVCVIGNEVSLGGKRYEIATVTKKEFILSVAVCGTISGPIAEWISIP